MKLDAKTYQDKVRGCWLGKNIGGTLGAPFECVRGVWDIDFYTQDMSGGALPNDDLDLQLIWLNAAEQYGRMVNAGILGEYWLSYVSANWSEYGAGKNNLAFGLLPPLSGWYHNHNRNSCGAFIRSEIWACLHPGRPDLAVSYAFEDAVVDHANEGVYAEVFCAALQSAAFAESDRDTLIQIGLSYIPDDCGVRHAVDTALDSCRSGLDWKAARKRVLQAEPGSFGMYAGYRDSLPEPDVPVGPLGYDAPSNIGILVLAWLYGGGDFGKSLCIAAGCGEDGDCTAATLGAILGIIDGASGLPETWTAPIGDGIKTISLDRTASNIKIPETVTELSERVCALAPTFMFGHCDVMAETGCVFFMAEGAQLYSRAGRMDVFGRVAVPDKLQTQPFGITQSNVLLDVTLCCRDGVTIREDTPVRFQMDLRNRLRKQQWLTCRWWMPDTWEGVREFSVNLDSPHGGYGTESLEVSLTPHGLSKARETVILEIASLGRPSRLYLPVTLVNSPQILR